MKRPDAAVEGLGVSAYRVPTDCPESDGTMEWTSTTLVVVEATSCLSVFRDETRSLFPADRDAMRLSRQSFTLGEFLERYGSDCQPPILSGIDALVQAHCHHQAVLGFDSDNKLLKKTGIDFSMTNSGSCGMAGAFGFERSKYDVSMKIAERALLPAVRQACEDTVIVADGFSCRTQIEQGAGRKAIHLTLLVLSPANNFTGSLP
jgi:Fe-S oxidoreductase